MHRFTWSIVVFAFLAKTALAADGERQPKPEPPPHANGPDAAAADMKKLTAANGVEATLFACEPMVVNPADMDVDERGRVWICEGANYRLTMHKDWGTPRPGGDRILILEDTDRDGRADKQTVYYQDPTVNTALGICVLGNKTIISSSPWVFVFTDTDGDGKADRRELLFEDSSKGQHRGSQRAAERGTTRRSATSSTTLNRYRSPESAKCQFQATRNYWSPGVGRGCLAHGRPIRNFRGTHIAV